MGQSTSTARVACVSLVLTLLVAAAACEDDNAREISDGDRAACNAAHANNARTVYNVRHQPTDAELKKLATRIYPDTNDTDAIKQIKSRCKDLGYQTP